METAGERCNCDTVFDMEEMRIGVPEILQYARAVLPRSELEVLIRGLAEIRAHSAAQEPPIKERIEQPEAVMAE